MHGGWPGLPERPASASAFGAEFGVWPGPCAGEGKYRRCASFDVAHEDRVLAGQVRMSTSASSVARAVSAGGLMVAPPRTIVYTIDIGEN
jgi:hypothetical protein